MLLLAFSDIHRDLAAVEGLRERAGSVDVLVGAGDFATMRKGLQPVIDAIASLDRPTVLVHGNGESEEELREACESYAHLRVLHGGAVEIEGVTFYGLGGAVPVTPFGAWSVDLTEEEATGLLAACPEGAVLVSHSPPLGHCDSSSRGEHIGSEAVLACILAARPALVLCGHVHDAWRTHAEIQSTRVYNLGPSGWPIEVG